MGNTKSRKVKEEVQPMYRAGGGQSEGMTFDD